MGWLLTCSNINLFTLFFPCLRLNSIIGKGKFERFWRWGCICSTFFKMIHKFILHCTVVSTRKSLQCVYRNRFLCIVPGSYWSHCCLQIEDVLFILELFGQFSASDKMLSTTWCQWCVFWLCSLINEPKPLTTCGLCQFYVTSHHTVIQEWKWSMGKWWARSINSDRSVCVLHTGEDFISIKNFTKIVTFGNTYTDGKCKLWEFQMQ